MQNNKIEAAKSKLNDLANAAHDAHIALQNLTKASRSKK